MRRIGLCCLLAGLLLMLSGQHGKPIELHEEPESEDEIEYTCHNYIDLDTQRQTYSEAWCQKRL